MKPLIAQVAAPVSIFTIALALGITSEPVPISARPRADRQIGANSEAPTASHAAKEPQRTTPRKPKHCERGGEPACLAVSYFDLSNSQLAAQGEENRSTRSPEAAPVRYEASHEAMGTLYSVVAYGRDQTYLSEVVGRVFEGIDQLDDQMSNYKPDSELSAINREAARRVVKVSPRLFGLIQYSLRWSRESGGDFDITVGPLMKLWGFFRGEGRLPDTREIALVEMRVGYRHVHLDPVRSTIRFDAAGVELDLGGIAKGYAVDQAAETLRSAGVTAALISSGGSSIYALGSPPGERGWKITVRDPLQREKPADVFHLQNFALSTSGSYEKFFEINGKTYCHIMDPHTGWPVPNMLCTVAAVATGVETEALTKVFFVGGVEKSRQCLATYPNAVGILYQPGDQHHTFKRVVVRSKSFALPPQSIAELGQ
jgi:FAD:protein FMN transferase